MQKFIIGFIVIVLILAIVIGNCSGDDIEEEQVTFVETGNEDITAEEIIKHTEGRG